MTNSDQSLLARVGRLLSSSKHDRIRTDEAEPAPPKLPALKLVIEAKRHHDAVRKREFAQLRKLRQSAFLPASAAAGSVSSFLDSDDFEMPQQRTSTLKKIDEIEAQMSQQWWQGQNSALLSEQPGLSASQNPSQAVDSDSAFATTIAADARLSEHFAATQYVAPELSADGSANTALTQVEAPAAPNSAPADGVHNDLAAPSFAASPELEQAAILFANQDDGAACTVLDSALQAPLASAQLCEAWFFALLELYYVNGQAEDFARCAQDFAKRLGRAAPPWPASVPAASSWCAAATLELPAIGQLQACVSQSEQPITLDWSQLQGISAPAAQALAALLAQWCEQTRGFYFVGATHLNEQLRANTALLDKQVARFWWSLRLNALRLQQLQNEFELAALDYCLTFEEQPAPWQAPCCQYLAQAPVLLAGTLDADAAQAATQGAAGCRAALLAVSCQQLIRVDFAAAGALLNWLTDVAASGGRVEFYEVPLLVGVFFNLLGVSEYARIYQRRY